MRIIVRRLTFLFLLAFLAVQCVEENLRVPEVSTFPATNVLSTSAEAVAIVMDDGGATVTARGICWSKTPNLPDCENPTDGGVGKGSFRSLLEGLEPSTRYFFRGYATNKIGTAYGEEFSFITKETVGASVTTGAVSAIASSTAKVEGTVTSTGDAIIVQRGICWSTDPEPTVALETKVIEGSGQGQFAVTIPGLSYGTVYHVRAYASYQNGTVYGNEVTFTTAPILPQVTAETISMVSASEANASGTVTDDGRGSISARGLCWSTSQKPTISLPTKTVEAGGSGAFSAVLTDLLPGTLYYVRAYASNEAGTAYSEEIVFTTPTVPSLTTTTLSISSAISTGGIISSDGGSLITAKGVCWSTNPNPTIELLTKTLDGNGDAAFASTIPRPPAGTYYVRAYATNIMGTSYGNELTFTQVGGITDGDGNTYEMIQIGTQRWMKENLKTSRYRDGSSITSTSSTADFLLQTNGAYHVYSNVPSYNEVYGKLYNFYAVADPRKLCPAGTHVPTLAEWQTLIDYAGGAFAAARALKEEGQAHWTDFFDGTNSLGFTALPAGSITATGLHFEPGTLTGWWTASEDSASEAWHFLLQNEFYQYSIQKKSGTSIRCIGD